MSHHDKPYRSEEISPTAAAGVSMNLSECTKLCNITYTSKCWMAAKWSRLQWNPFQIQGSHCQGCHLSWDPLLCPLCPPWTIATTATVAILWPGTHNSRDTTMQYYYVWQLSLLHNLDLVQGWVLSAARSKGGLTKPRTPSPLPSLHTKVFQSGQSVS